MRHLAALAVVLLAVSGAPQTADACTCMMPGAPCEEFWKVSAVFVGRVEAVTRQTSKTPRRFLEGRRVTFTVTESFKGISERNVEIRTGLGGGDCGYNFKEGRDYLVYASRNDDGQLVTGICARTRSVEEAEADLAYARATTTGASTLGRISGDVKLGHRSLARERTREPDPMPGVTVRFENAGSIALATTDAQGSFMVDSLSAGTYVIALEISDRYYAQIDPNPVQLVDSRGCAEIRATVFEDGHVRGRVVDSAGRPIEGLTVELTVPLGLDQSFGPERIRTLTRGDGRYELTRVPPGKFVVGINTQRDRDGNLPLPRLFHPGVVRLDQATQVLVPAGERVELADFVIPADVEFVHLSGVVVDADGTPAEGARVYLKGPAEADYILAEAALTDGTGRFVLAAIRGRDYRLFAERSHPVRRNSHLESSDQVLLTADGNLVPFRLTLRRRY